jgi:molybdenum cofactor guanylyltransferase
MQILGVVLAGGASRRFGSDKANFKIDGLALIDHCIEVLSFQCDTVVVCGREWPGQTCLLDRPEGSAGPLAGLNAALHHAQRHGCEAVLAAPVDVYPLPRDLVDRLGRDSAAVFAVQHLVGWWPAILADRLDAFIADGGRAVHRWIEHIGARHIAEPIGLTNINYQEDIQRIS